MATIRDYTAKIIAERASQPSFDKLSYVPIAIPAGSAIPETMQQTMSRLMLKSGMISQDDYEKMIGVSYDGDFAAADEIFDDDGDFASFGESFAQSSFAKYDDDFENSVAAPVKEAVAPYVEAPSETPPPPPSEPTQEVSNGEKA